VLQFLLLVLECLFFFLQEFFIILLVLLFLLDLLGGLSTSFGLVSTTTSCLICYLFEDGGDHLLSHFLGSSLGTEGIHDISLGLLDSCLGGVTLWGGTSSSSSWLVIRFLSICICDRSLSSLFRLLRILFISNGRFLLLLLSWFSLCLLSLGRLGLSHLFWLLLLITLCDLSGGGLSSGIIRCLGLGLLLIVGTSATHYLGLLSLFRLLRSNLREIIIVGCLTFCLCFWLLLLDLLLLGLLLRWLASLSLTILF